MRVQIQAEDSKGDNNGPDSAQLIKFVEPSTFLQCVLRRQVSKDRFYADQN